MTPHTDPPDGNGNVQQLILQEVRGQRKDIRRLAERIAALEQDRARDVRAESERRKDRRWIIGAALSGLGGLLAGLWSALWQAMAAGG